MFLFAEEFISRLIISNRIAVPIWDSGSDLCCKTEALGVICHFGIDHIGTE
jgi:hypothetical protein